MANLNRDCRRSVGRSLLGWVVSHMPNDGFPPSLSLAERMARMSLQIGQNYSEFKC